MRIGFSYNVHPSWQDKLPVIGGVKSHSMWECLGAPMPKCYCMQLRMPGWGLIFWGELVSTFLRTIHNILELILEKYKRINHIGVKGYTVHNIGTAVAAEAGKTVSCIQGICYNIAEELKINAAYILVSDATPEGLSFEGNSQGFSAEPLVSIEPCKQW